MLRELCGECVLSRSLRVLLEVARIDRIAIVVSDATEQAAQVLTEQLDSTRRCLIVRGGAERSDSVYAGLLALVGAQIAVIHDGARCLVSAELIENSIDSAVARGSGVVMVRAKDTVKRVSADTVIETPDRSELYLVQTPQTFRYELIRRAYDDAIAAKARGTDDASFVERIGQPVYVVEGSYNNIKITTEEDIAVAEAILRREIPQRQETEEPAMRIGFGEDTHKLVEGRALILGGVNIPYQKGLLGHSDADVLVHAVMDALLGAAALGDIGKHFPDTDERYRGADSVALLGHVASLLDEYGYRTVNLDATVVAQAPKLAPHVIAMRENIANAAGIDVNRVSVKATTSEELGFEGRGEGMTARCVALITKR